MFTGGAPKSSGQKNVGDAYFVKVMAPAGTANRKAHARFPRKGRARTLTLIASVVLLLPALLASGAFLAFGGGRSNADVRTYSLFSASDGPRTVPSDSNASANDSGSVELGVKFRPQVDGYVTGIKFFKGAGNTGTHIGTLWSSSGSALAQATFTSETDSGWQTATFSTPVAVSRGDRLVASYHASAGHYAFTHWYFKRTLDTGVLKAPESTDRSGNGVYNYGNSVAFPSYTWKASNYWVDVTFATSAGGSDTPTTTASIDPTTNAPATTAAPTTTVTAAPTTTATVSTTVPRTTTTPPTSPPTTAPPAPTTTVAPVNPGPPTGPSGGFPDASNTGVPAGTALSNYTGPMTITSCGAVIDSKIVNGDLTILAGNGTHSAATPCVTVRNSLIKGEVHNGYASQNRGPLVMTDSEIAVPMPNDGASAALDEANFYVWRLNIHNARSNVMCDGFCEMHDSYVHDNYYVNTAHMGGFLTNGNYGNPILLDHNTIHCDLANPSAGNSNGGCSGDLNFFGDFSAISHITVTNNQLIGSSDPSYCAYTGASQSAKPYPTGTNIVWRGNVWQRGETGKCGWAGAVFDWQNNAGNNWCDNTWDDGSAVLPGVPCVHP